MKIKKFIISMACAMLAVLFLFSMAACSKNNMGGLESRHNAHTKHRVAQQKTGNEHLDDITSIENRGKVDFNKNHQNHDHHAQNIAINEHHAQKSEMSNDEVRLILQRVATEARTQSRVTKMKDENRENNKDTSKHKSPNRLYKIIMNAGYSTASQSGFEQGKVYTTSFSLGEHECVVHVSITSERDIVYMQTSLTGLCDAYFNTQINLDNNDYAVAISGNIENINITAHNKNGHFSTQAKLQVTSNK
jgi:hypothetical protein